MKQKKLPLMVGALLSLYAVQTITATTAYAQSEIVVTAERYPLKKSEVPNSISVITAEQIEDAHVQTVGDILRGQSGIDVVQSGGPGGNTSVFMRGANAEHTLVYIDGVEANNPIAATRTFDFANIGIDNIESIEIVRGPQSVLYGSDALGGVILITTKKGSENTKGSISGFGGSYGTFGGTASVQGKETNTSYSLSLSQKNADSFSAANRRLGNAESDGYKNTNFSGLAKTVYSKNVDLTLTARYANARSELDNFGGMFGDDVNRVLNSNNLITRAELGTHFFDNALQQKIGYSFTDQWFSDNNATDMAHPMDETQSGYTGKLSKFDLQNLLSVSEDVKAVIGYENKTESGSGNYISNSAFGPYSEILNDKTVSTNSYYGQGSWTPVRCDESGTGSITAGARIDDNSIFGSQFTWKAGPVVQIDKTKLSASYATGFKAPSIYQLYSIYGNSNLEPEKSRGWEVGVDQTISKDYSVGVTYFDSNFDNLISFNPATFISENINQASSRGLETTVRAQLSSELGASLSHTLTDTEDKITELELLRRPKHKGKIGIEYAPTDTYSVSVDVIVRGKSFDNDFATFPATRTVLGGYATTSVSAKYKVSEPIEVSVWGVNIFDKKYEDVLGYGTQGASVFGGIKYSFE